MITSLAVTFNSKTPDTAREEADKLFTALFGKDKYAVGGAEITPAELSDPYEVFEDATDPATGENVKVVRVKRDTINWQATFAAHPIA